MKSFHDFITEETPTMHANVAGAEGGFGNAGTNALGNTGFGPVLFTRPGEDLLSQDYQTPGQSGLAKWRFSNVWPVEKLTMAGIDNMVAASKEFVDKMDENNQRLVRKNFSRFMVESSTKQCPAGKYWCHTDKECKKIPRGWHVGSRGWLVQDHDDNGKKKNGNGNGSHNGNGSSNGNGGGNGSGNGNGGGGNGGGGE